MYLVAIFFTFALALMGIGGLEMALSYEHAQVHRIAARAASDAMTQAEQSYVDAIGTAFQTDLKNGTAFDPAQASAAATGSLCWNSSGTAPAGGKAVSGAGGSSCNYVATYTVTIGGSTVAGGGGETSQNVDVNAGEVRFSATIAMLVRNSAGLILARKNRTVTLRAYPMAPWASVVNSSDTQDPFVSGSGTIGGVGAAADGDSAGCNSSASCNTTMNAYAVCVEGTPSPTPSPSTVAMQQTWCNDQGAATAGGTTYNAAATVPPSSQWLTAPVQTTNDQNQTWNAGTSGV